MQIAAWSLIFAIYLPRNMDTKSFKIHLTPHSRLDFNFDIALRLFNCIFCWLRISIDRVISRKLLKPFNKRQQ